LLSSEKVTSDLFGSVFAVMDSRIKSTPTRDEGRLMEYFQTKNPILGKFWRVLQWRMLVYFMAIWYILWLFGIFYGYLVYFMAIWYILWLFRIFYGYLVYFMAVWSILRPFVIFCGHSVYLMVI
jgi:hypothetical protein